MPEGTLSRAGGVYNRVGMRDFIRRHAWPLGILAGALALRLALFTGLQGNDDTIYSRIAYGLSQGDLAPRADVFWMRLGYVVPIAVLYKVLGVHVVALVLPNLAAVGLFCSLRLHQDGTRQRWGIEESYTQLRSRTGQLVVTDPRSAEMLRFLSGYRPAFTAVGYTPADPPPAPGTLLLDDERRVALHEGWDGVTPPGWWRAKEPPREVLFERERGAPWRLRGPSGPPDRVILSRVAGHR